MYARSVILLVYEVKKDDNILALKQLSSEYFEEISEIYKEVQFGILFTEEGSTKGMHLPLMDL